MKKYGLFLLCSFLYVASAGAESLTLTTYYPAPFGAYDRLRIVPRDAALTDPCDIGTIYADKNNASKLQYCYPDVNPNQGKWGPLGSSLWIADPDGYLYPEDNNLFVGIGTEDPAAHMEISGAAHQDLLVTSTTAGHRMAMGAGNNAPFMEFTGSVFHLLYEDELPKTGDGWGTSYMAVRDNGNVGLGISWPSQAHLEVQGNGHQGIVVTSVSAGNRVSIGAGNTNPYIEFNSDKPFQIITNAYSEVGFGNGARVFVAEGDGDIGMGTDTPLAKLHLQGGGGMAALRIQETSNEDAVWELRAHEVGVPDANFGNDLSIWGGQFASEGYRMVFKSNGNVGLGTTKPQEKFQIGDRFTFHDGGYKVISRNTYYGGAPAEDRRIFNDEVAAMALTDTGDILFRTAPAGVPDSLVQGGTWWVPPLFIRNDGKIGVLTKTPAYQFEIASGDLNVKAGMILINGTCVEGCASDMRVKKNVKPLEGALEKLSMLEPIEFEYTNTHYGQGVQYGLSAQEVEKIFPQWVSEDENEVKHINYGAQFQVQMLEAIKELKQENDQLKERIRALENTVK